VATTHNGGYDGPENLDRVARNFPDEGKLQECNTRFKIRMKVLAFFEFGDVSAARWQWVQRCWALFGLLLILATWRLWIPQNVYPQVPFLRIAGSLPAVCQWAALAVVVVVLVITLGLLPRLNNAGKAWLFLTFVVAMAVLILTDQHRLQPWAYQLVICAVVFGTVPSDTLNRRRGWALLRMLTLSIYLFSALGKFDFQFLNTVGQQFLSVGLGNFGISIDQWQWSFRLLLAAIFPLAEISVVITLTVPQLRRVGVAATVLLHLLLLFVLGPMGLQHQPGVLIWNVFFIAQALLLFSGPQRSDTADGEVPKPDERTRHRWAPTCVVLAVVVLPLLEPIGWFDHWPAWGLYSPRNSRAIVEVHRAGLRKLPADLHRYLSSADSDTMWVQLNIDDWSLATLSVPIYPQDRFQLGVAEAIATRYDLDRTIQVRLLGMSNRMSGVREEKTLTGRHQIVSAADQFRLNAHPADSR
jgi:hypothetical protein